jgi:hypothetical protein
VTANGFSNGPFNISSVSLSALRAFEAAVRHLSFTRAGLELSVTQAAISHQVKGLEARLGLELFRRELDEGILVQPFAAEIDLGAIGSPG